MVYARIIIKEAQGGRDGCHDQGTAQEPSQTPALPALQLRQNNRQRAVPPLSYEVAGSNAGRFGGHSLEGHLDRDARASRGRELLRRPFLVRPKIRGRQETLV